jgi:baculoviral IAP repeat-containing protein 6 (apollon)
VATKTILLCSFFFVRHSYYWALLDGIEALCSPAAAGLLSWQGPDGKSLTTVVAAAHSQASRFLQVYDQAGGGEAAAGTAKGAAATPGLPQRQQGDATSSIPDAEAREVELARRLLEIAEKVSSAVAAAAPLVTRRRAAEAASLQAAMAAPSDEESRYVSAMAPFRVAIVPGVATNHQYSGAASGESRAPPKARARRVGRELASCESDLPVSTSSSIFVAADEANCTLWKAVITGPQGTPYEGGCFLFDIYFPPASSFFLLLCKSACLHVLSLFTSPP